MLLLDNKEEVKSKDDVFGAYLCKDIEFDDDCVYDIPFVGSQTSTALPDHLVTYGKLGTTNIKPNTFVHFYQKDYTFDGRYGIWNSLVYNQGSKKGFTLSKLKDISGIITPDYSVYYDMPAAMRIWNTYRSRVVGHFFRQLGYQVITNVRWTDQDSYSYSFAGIRAHDIVAVSTLGCLRNNYDKVLFINGLNELIHRKKPKTIVLYGSLSNEIKNLLDNLNQAYIFFPSEISKAYGDK